jgi:uncharacterized membrane protein
MRASVIGLAVGLTLGFAGVFGGFDAFIIVLVLGLVGFLAGWVVERNIDVRGYLSGQSRTRR